MKKVFLFASLIAFSACGDTESGTGTVEVAIYGEPFIEAGIPAGEMADGWAVNFTDFSVSLKNVSGAGVSITEKTAIQLAKDTMTKGTVLLSEQTDAGTYSDWQYTLYDVSITGTATKDQTTKSFTWDFPSEVLFENCDTSTKVEADATAQFQITIHADHLFYDSLVAADPDLRFEALAAADANQDDTITLDELAQADIGSYDAGNASVSDLKAWLIAQMETVGHVDGEGHCD